MSAVTLMGVWALASTITPALWAGLVPGPHIVGYREIESAEKLRVSVWYPAVRAGQTLTLGDLFGAARADEAAVLLQGGVARETVDRYLDSWLVASRDAPAAGGRFPLVLVAQGNRQSAAAQAVLSEYLASHGFIVATTASPTIATPMTSEDQVGAFAQRQAMELSRAAGAVTRNFPGADASRIGLVGHSFGARAALLLAMQDARVSALVSLDGGIGTATGMTSLRREPSFRPKRMRAPILHLYEELDPFMKPDFTLFGELPVRIRTERVGGLRHVHFSTMGFGAAAFKELAAASGAGAEVAAGVRLMGERTVEFLSSLLADSPNRR